MALLYQQQGSPALARINTFQPNFLLLKTINFWSELLCSWWSHYRGIRHSHVYWQQHPLSLTSQGRVGVTFELRKTQIMSRQLLKRI